MPEPPRAPPSPSPRRSTEGPSRRSGPSPANPVDPNYWQPVDAAFQRLLESERADDPHPWLLTQTLLTAVARRALYPALRLHSGARVLDAGTGFAPVAVELAGAFGCAVVGVDNGVHQLRRAAIAAADLERADWLAAPRITQTTSTVSFAGASVESLPFASGTFDAVIARFLLQHVDDPTASVEELSRVVRAGGVVCIIDVDDGLSVRYPEPPEPIRCLEEAYSRAQSARGGDRTIGRKVAGMLDAAGIEVDHVLALPYAAYNAASPPTGPGQRLVHERLSAFAEEFVARGILDEAAASDGLRMLATEQLPPATVVDVHLGVIGHRRPAR